MKTNLKKAISAVSALALASSLAPASFAAKLTLSDVADTASYATAVNTLVALDVINGYEDGTFLPDNNITRAEATKVMVAALNQIDSAEGMKGSTQFKDVEAKHEWATGFINAGVQAGYINGMGDGTFAPDANVTYAQMVKMLVSAMGYNEYAEFMGGYPNGFLAIASSEGVTDGVKANANDNVTRAQVAQLVYNALTTPIVDDTGMEYTSNGQLVQSISKMDGKGSGDDFRNYKSLLTENFDAYFVEGYVTETAKDGQGLEKDEVKFGVAKSEKYDSDEFGLQNMTPAKDVSSLTDVKNGSNRIKTVKVGDTDAADYKGVFATAIILVDENEDMMLLSFQPSGKNKSVTVDASLIDDDEYDAKAFNAATDTYLKVFANDTASTSSKYQLETDSKTGKLMVNVYVNGIKVVDASATDAAIRNEIQKYVVKAEVGDVEFVDTYRTNGEYDTINVSKYATAIVDSYIGVSKDLAFKDCYVGAGETAVGLLSLDEEENEDLIYHIYLNGEEIKPGEIEEDDVLSIAYDPTKTLATSNFYEIYVARDVKTGKLTGKNDEDKVVTVAGETYSFVTDYASNTSSLEMGNEYTINVDAFGRIYKYEINASVAKYAIVDAYLEENSAYDDRRVRLFTADGEQKTLVLDASKTTTTVKVNGTTYTGAADIRKAVNKAVYGGETTTPANSARTAIKNRVVKYEVSSSTGYIRSLEFLTGAGTTGQEEYKASTSKIGSIKVNDATKVIDAIDYVKAYGKDPSSAKYSDLVVASKDSFANEAKYEVYAYGDKVDGVYPFVLVVGGAAAYNADTRLAIIDGATGEGTDDVGDKIYNIPVRSVDGSDVMVGSDELAVYVAGDKGTISGLTRGDVIVYKTNSKGYINQIDVLFSLKGETYETIVDKVIAGTDVVTLLKSDKTLTGDFSEKWTESFAKPAVIDPIQLVVGPVVAKGNNSFTLANTVGSQTNLDKDFATKDAIGGIYEIELANDVAVYEYNFENSSSTRLSNGVAGSILTSIFTKEAYVGDNKDSSTIDWKDAAAKKNVQLAFAKVVDGEATDVLVIKGDYNKQ